MNNESLVHEFFDEQTTQETKDAMDNASAHARLTLTVSGKYRMKADTFAYVKDDEEKQFPTFQRSSNVGVMQLVIPFRVVDGTPEAPKGSLLFFSMNVAPEKGAAKERRQVMARMAKPHLVAMLGHEDIPMDPGWLLNNLVPKYKREGDEMILERDHALKNEVMVTVEDDYYNNKPTLKVTTIVAAAKSDVSVSNKPKEPVDVGGKDPVDIDYSNVDDAEIVSAEQMADDAIAEGEKEGSGSPNLDAKTEDF